MGKMKCALCDKMEELQDDLCKDCIKELKIAFQKIKIDELKNKLKNLEN